MKRNAQLNIISMDATVVVGIGASALTATSLIPQVIKLLKERNSEHVSLLMLTVLLAGLVLWIYYGALKSDLIIIVSNAFAAFINIVTFVLALRFKNK